MADLAIELQKIYDSEINVTVRKLDAISVAQQLSASQTAALAHTPTSRCPSERRPNVTQRWPTLDSLDQRPVLSGGNRTANHQPPAALLQDRHPARFPQD